MNNWFEVGEEVIVVSPNYPEINGEYRIKGFISKEEACLKSIGTLSAVRKFKSELYAILDGLLIEDHGVGWISYDFTGISTLRKKHNPSQESFKDMMQNIMNVPNKNLEKV